VRQHSRLPDRCSARKSGLCGFRRPHSDVTGSKRFSARFFADHCSNSWSSLVLLARYVFAVEQHARDHEAGKQLGCRNRGDRLKVYFVRVVYFGPGDSLTHELLEITTREPQRRKGTKAQTNTASAFTQRSKSTVHLCFALLLVVL